MSTETLALHRINTQLLNLGWVIEGDKRNVFLEGECATPEHKKKLGRKRTDYILCSSNSVSPLAIIEAKKPGLNLEKAIDQGIKYAKMIDAKVVFATDSYVTKAVNLFRRPLTIDGEILKDFVDEKKLEKLSQDSDLKTDSKVISHRNDLITIFSRAEDALRQDGIDVGMDAIYEFCSVLFVKIKSEIDSEIESYYSWDKLCSLKGKELLEHYKKTIEHFKKKYSGIFRDIKITEPKSLENIVNSLKGLNLSDTSIDIKGASYEHFLKRYSSKNKSVLGQHFTPRHIIEMMCILLDPKIKETIYDPFCGTGGMLIETYKLLRKNIETEEEIKILNKNMLFGSDISFGASQLAKMNMVILGDGHSNIEKKNSLREAINGKYGIVIANIPFNLPSEAKGSISNTSKTNSNILCIQHCIEAIKNGGRACIIVPDNICYDARYKDLRRYLSNIGNIEAVIRLPRETFKAYTTAKACILFIENIKVKKTNSFAYVEIKNDGYSEGTWREPIPGSEIPTILENRENLKEKFKEIKLKDLNSDFEFFVEEARLETNKEYYLLKDVIEVKEKKEKLESSKKYQEPRLSSATNTIKGKWRLGSNIKSEKVIIEPGDLVIGTLHTQQGNGLFAFSDDDYIATSQIVAKVKEDAISKDYLKIMLKKLLPLLKTDDLVGRETYKPKEILNIKIPKQPKNFDEKHYKKLLEKPYKALSEIQEYENQFDI